jgi:hypothetical protein
MTESAAPEANEQPQGDEMNEGQQIGGVVSFVFAARTTNDGHILRS